MNGILVIDKPVGLTSHDVVGRVRRILKTRRVGHTGTLDPFATGVLVLLVGKATRLAQFLDKDQKEYEAVIRFGFETDTGDLTGSPIADREMRMHEINDKLDKTDWNQVLSEFRGEIEQIPPMYSAKRIKGKKLYELARKGKEVKRQPIHVTILDLELLGNRNFRDRQSTIRIRVVCSAGTYIRTLAEDIGRKVGTGAHLTELRRTRAGRFDLATSLSLKELEDLDDPGSALRPMVDALKHLPSMDLSNERAAKTRNGLSTRITDTEFNDGEAIQMLDANNELIAVGFYSRTEKIVQPKIVLE